jgi:hypothetical protein
MLPTYRPDLQALQIGILAVAAPGLVGSVALAVWLYGKRQINSRPPAQNEDRIPRRTKLLAEREEQSAKAVVNDRPKRYKKSRSA